MSSFIFTASCPSRLGTVDLVTRHLCDLGCYISELNSFDDELNSRFFIRVEFNQQGDKPFDESDFQRNFGDKARAFEMEWELTNKTHKPSVVIMVSKYDHCLNDLLYRYRTNNLKVEIRAVISNHEDLRELTQWHGIPYYYFPISYDTKFEQEQCVQTVLEDAGCELLILARYMQVLSRSMCKSWTGKAINIHHSLLPGFKGAKPYHQAYNKGVKLVGATAHYVSSDLDEGPIITQGMETVNHSYYPQDLARKGKYIEAFTLARAIQYHIEKRVFLFDDKTIVFERS
ncbi:formyltetrahydrofolate deformylase [Vibrio sp. nBUS_14]|uniref:formyltetrahydrofolate deformylase n=1 Tax=Vibrio sp. nBUS_14 TaxID=3395321 RepID=UPI003EBA007C